MSQAALRPHSILCQLPPLPRQHRSFLSLRSCPQPSCHRYAAAPDLSGCSVSLRAESGPAAQPSIDQDRGLRQQQHWSTPTPSQTSSSAGVLASAAVLVSLAWADEAQAGIGESISEFVDARSSVTTALATIAFLLLLVLTAGVSQASLVPVLATGPDSSCTLHQVRLPATQPAVRLTQVIYLSVSAWGDRTSESKDRRDEERAERCAQARGHAPCRVSVPHWVTTVWVILRAYCCTSCILVC